MIYTNSFEEDRYLSSLQREAEAFKKLIEDRQVSRGIPIMKKLAEIHSEHGYPDIQQQPPRAHER